MGYIPWDPIPHYFRSLFTSRHIALVSACVVFLPVLLHSSVLFYTDQLSLILILFAFPLPPRSSVLFFALSLLVRQTNISWAFLYAGYFLISRIEPSRPFS